MWRDMRSTVRRGQALHRSKGGYAIAGQLPRPALQALAASVYRQL